MTPTRAQVITYAQTLVGDPLGTLFVDNATPNPGQINIGLGFEGAYRELASSYDYYQCPAAIFEFWYNLPAYTSLLNPVQAGLNNFQQPQAIDERDIADTVNISSIAAGTPITVNTASSISAAGINDQEEILISGTTGGVGANGRFFCTIVTDTQLTLNGSIGTGTFTASTGIITTSNDIYTTVQQLTELPDRLPNNRLWEYTFKNQNFYFVGATEPRQLRLTYFASGQAPTTGSTGYDDSLDFLAFRTAGIGADMIGSARAQGLHTKAQAFLEFLLTQAVRELQRNPIRQRAYRSGGYVRSATDNPSGVLLPG
jgi:hypothetical protein